MAEVEHNALKGLLRGENRADVIAKAKELTEKYFGTKCIKIRLDRETPHFRFGEFTVTFTGIVWHDIDPRSYGPNVCRGCDKRDWPHDRLNEKTKEEWI